MTAKKPTIIRGPYLADLLAQPDAVERTLAALSSNDPKLLEIASQLSADLFERVVLTGMGSSLASLQPIALRLIAKGITTLIVDTSELIHAMRGLLDESTLVIAVSQSGRSAEIVRLVTRTNREETLIAVTNTADSPLAKAAHATVLTRAGEESTVSCKTYVATLAALGFVGDVLCERDHAERATHATHATRATNATNATHAMNAMDAMDAMKGAPAAMRAWLARWETHVDELLSITASVRDVFFAGRGASLAAVYTAGLIVKESTRVHAEGMTSAALRHGPMEMSAPHVLALVYEGDADVAPLNRTLVDDLKRAGMRAHLVCMNGSASAASSVFLPDVPLLARPLFEILPAQMLSLALAAHAGIEAGRFVHASKVTSTE